jgi:dTDP-4-dehydrorhamnose reductase
MGKGVVAVFGGKGMLGRDMVIACARRGYDTRIYDLPAFDLTSPGQVKEAVDAADIVINCAAYTNVDGAESDRELAYRVNAEAVGHLGRLAGRHGKWVLHFSTDFVFDGRLDRPYGETDAPNPINEYGRSKLAGERLLRDSGCSHCIVRLEWTYGSHGKSFVTKIIERAAAGGCLRVVADQVGSPTATTEVAEMACEMTEKQVEGIFHFAGAGYVSRFDAAKFMVERLSLKAKLLPCRSTDYPAPARRPLNSRFDCSKIQALLDEPIRPWQEPLESFLRRL